MATAPSPLPVSGGAPRAPWDGSGHRSTRCRPMRARQVKVLERLLSGEGRHTLKQLAAEAQVSRKTLQRELPFYKEWLRGFGIQLRTRPRRGLEVSATREQREAALRALHRIRPARQVPARRRRLLILQELLRSPDGAKLAYFARRFGVAESTISNDLDRVEPWLRQRGLSLDRHPGRGLRLEGPELAWRRAVVDVIREGLTDEQLYGALQQMARRPGDAPPGAPAPHGAPSPLSGDNALNPLPSFIEEEILQPVVTAVRDVAREFGLRLADGAMAGLIVHLALAVTRLRRGEAVRLPARVLEDLEGYREWGYARELAARVERALGLSLPADEVGYITMHLKGARLRALPDPWDLLEPDHAEALLLARRMVAQAEELLGLPLRHVPEVVRGLAIHLVAAISRLRLGLEIRNPLLAQIKEEYPDLFAISARACRVLGEHLRCQVPEAEVGYIAMHLGAAVERLRDAGHGAYRAVLVCATGVGSSQILASRLAHLVPEIRVTEIMTSLELAERLRPPAAPPDLVVSTIPVEAPGVPVVVVSPLLESGDVIAIRNVLKQVEEARRRGTNAAPAAAGTAPPDPAAAAGAGSVGGPGTPAPGQEPGSIDPWSAPGPGPTGPWPAPGTGGPWPASGTGTAADRLALVARRGPLVWRLVTDFVLHEGAVPDPVTAAVELTRRAGACRDPGLLAADLRRREELGATPVTPWLHLLHCRSRGAGRPFLGALRDPEAGRCWLVMVVPEEATPEVLEVCSAVSIGLIERPEMAETLQAGSEAAARQALAEILYPLVIGPP